MNEIMIHVNDREVPVPVREYDGKRFVTFREVDTVHGRPEGTAKRNFKVNRNHFVVGEDYYKIPLAEFRAKFVPNSGKRGNPDNEVVLLTEQGYLLLVKSFTDDLAWNVQRQLVKAYFRSAQPTVSAQLEQLKTELIEAMEQKFDTITASFEHLVQAPRPSVDSAQIWKAKMIDMIKMLVKDYPSCYEDYGSVFRAVYDRMNRNYGFVADQARKEYMARYKCEKSPSRFECVSHDPVWSSIFSSILINLGEESKAEKPEKSMKEVIAPLIAARHDKSLNGCNTYKIVFVHMEHKHDVQWEQVAGAYKRTHKNFSPKKVVLVNANPKLKALFNQSVAELLAEVKAGGAA